jgi:hypothetical protein
LNKDFWSDLLSTYICPSLPLVLAVVFIETFRIHCCNGGGSVVARNFVRQLPKISSKQYRSSIADKDGLGGI